LSDPRRRSRGRARGDMLSAMRVVGRRKHVPGDRRGLDALVLRFGGGAPKGVFRYRSVEEANGDWDRWTSERVQRRTKTSATSSAEATSTPMAGSRPFE
jgi:hypothetical protein